jgi:hypothetical protein
MKKILIFIYLSIIFSSSASALVFTDVYSFSLHNAHGYFDDGGEYFVYLEGGSPNNIIITDSTGTSYTIGTGNTGVCNPQTVYCTAEGTIYYGDNTNLFVRIGSGDTTPKDLGDSENYLALGSYGNVNAWCEDQNYVYFFSESNDVVYAIGKNDYLVSSVMALTSSYFDVWVADMEIIGDDFYFYTNRPNYYKGGYIVKNDAEYIYTYANGYATVGNDWGGSLLRYNDSAFYIAGWDSNHGKYVKKINDNGSQFSLIETTVFYINYGGTNLASTNLGSCMALGTDSPIMVYKDGDDLAVVSVDDVLFTSYSESSESSNDNSSDSSTDNPLLSLDSPEDAEEFAKDYTGVTWILLIFLFLMAAMGSKK